MLRVALSRVGPLPLSLSKECCSTVREEALYQTMFSAVTPTLWVFHIILVLPHINVFTYCLPNQSLEPPL